VALAAIGSANAPAGAGGQVTSGLKLREIARFANPTYVTQAPGEPGRQKM
jgi:hypothetical protein